MNETTNATATPGDDTPARTRFSSVVADLVGPPAHDLDPARRPLRRLRRAVALACAVAVLVQVIVWLLIAVLGGGLDTPWWLWSAAPAALAVAALTLAERRRATDPHV